jgi:hypothetical protein
MGSEGTEKWLTLAKICSMSGRTSVFKEYFEILSQECELYTTVNKNIIQLGPLISATIFKLREW